MTENAHCRAITNISSFCICCGSIFYSWFQFYFPLFGGMVMYDTINETMGNKNNLNQG